MANTKNNKSPKASNNPVPALQEATFTELATKAYPKDFAQFKQAIEEERLSHLYLLVGAGDDEKVALAQSIAALVLGEDDLTKQRIAAFDHPDFVTVLPEKQGAAIKIAQIRALVPELTTTALEGDRKIFVIDQVDTLTTAAANSLLKFIEEPAGPQLILLLANRQADVLPTIRSRAQLVHLQPSEHVNQEVLDAEEAFRTQAQSAVFKWFEKAMQRDISVLAYLQSDVLPLVTNGKEEAQVMTWLQMLGRDLALYSYVNVEDLSFSQLVGFYKQMAKNYQPKQLLAVGDLILKTDQLRQVNISFQSRLEKLGLEMAIALG